MPDDAALFERHNPIPCSEQNETVDNCIFRGWLKNESYVSVAMSGGCPYSDSFEVRKDSFCVYTIHLSLPREEHLSSVYTTSTTPNQKIFF